MEQRAVQIPHQSVSKASALKLAVIFRLAPVRSLTSVVCVVGMALAAGRYQAHIIKSCKTAKFNVIPVNAVIINYCESLI